MPSAEVELSAKLESSFAVTSFTSPSLCQHLIRCFKRLTRSSSVLLFLTSLINFPSLVSWNTTKPNHFLREFFFFLCICFKLITALNSSCPVSVCMYVCMYLLMFSYYGSQWGSVTVTNILPTFFFCIQQKKLIQVWNNLRVSKLCFFE